MRKKSPPCALPAGAVCTATEARKVLIESICGCQRLDRWIFERRREVFIYLGLNKEMIYQFTSFSHPPFSSGELISCLTRGLRQTGRQTEGNREMMGVGRRHRG